MRKVQTSMKPPPKQPMPPPPPRGAPTGMPASLEQKERQARTDLYQNLAVLAGTINQMIELIIEQEQERK